MVSLYSKFDGLSLRKGSQFGILTYKCVLVNPLFLLSCCWTQSQNTNCPSLMQNRRPTFASPFGNIQALKCIKIDCKALFAFSV